MEQLYLKLKLSLYIKKILAVNILLQKILITSLIFNYICLVCCHCLFLAFKKTKSFYGKFFIFFFSCSFPVKQNIEYNILCYMYVVKSNNQIYAKSIIYQKQWEKTLVYQSTLAYSVEILYSAYKLRANIKFLACGAVLLVSKQLFLFTDSHNIYFLKGPCTSRVRQLKKCLIVIASLYHNAVIRFYIVIIFLFSLFFFVLLRYELFSQQNVYVGLAYLTLLLFIFSKNIDRYFFAFLDV